jgi:hypothetical protein
VKQLMRETKPFSCTGEIRQKHALIIFVSGVGERLLAATAGTLLRSAMREEFASYSFLAVTIAGIVLLCSGLVALALT